jgi:hypothetical protein
LDIPCGEITTRPGDFNDPTFCGELDLPNPICPLCELKLRLFKALHTSEDSNTREILETELEFIYSETRGERPQFQVNTVVAALRDLRTVRSTPNAVIVEWNSLGEEEVVIDSRAVPRYWF